jgi:hypothetical protein
MLLRQRLHPRVRLQTLWTTDSIKLLSLLSLLSGITAINGLLRAGSMHLLGAPSKCERRLLGRLIPHPHALCDYRTALMRSSSTSITLSNPACSRKPL